MDLAVFLIILAIEIGYFKKKYWDLNSGIRKSDLNENITIKAYMKHYVNTHLKFWYIYVLNIFVIVPMFFGSLMLIYIYAMTITTNDVFLMVLTLLTYAVIATVFLIGPNIAVVGKYANRSRGKRLKLTMINQLISIVLFCITLGPIYYHMILNWTGSFY